MKSNDGSINTVDGGDVIRCRTPMERTLRTGAPPGAASKFHSARKPIAGLGIVAALGMLLSACANPGAAALGTNVPLTPAPELAGAATPGVVIWRAPELAEHERAATAYLIPPVTVYRGKGSFYSDLSAEQVDGIAANLTQNVRAEIGRHFKIVNQPGPGVVTISLILAKITPPHAEYSAVGLSNLPATAVGMPEGPGTTAGTMTVSGKFSDSQSGRLLVGFVAPVSPEVMDLPRPGNPARALDFADAASHQFSIDLVNAIIRQRQINKVSTPK